MNISDLIDLLFEERLKNGDIEVKLHDSGCEGSSKLWTPDEETFETFTDPETKKKVFVISV